MASTQFVAEGGVMTSQGKGDFKIFKMASRAQCEFVAEGADVTGEGVDFQNLKMASCAFRIGATYWMFKVHWVRVGIWTRLGKFSRFFIHFVLAPPIGCLRYFGSAWVFGPALVNFPGFSYISYWRHL